MQRDRVWPSYPHDRHAVARVPNYSIIVHYAEIALKGKNQRDFRRKLCENLRLKLTRDGLKCPVYETQGMVEVRLPNEYPADRVDPVIRELAKVFGVSWVARAIRLPRTTDDSQRAHVELARKHLLEDAQARYAPFGEMPSNADRSDISQMRGKQQPSQ